MKSKYEPMLRFLQSLIMIADKPNQKVVAELTAIVIGLMRDEKKRKK